MKPPIGKPYKGLRPWGHSAAGAGIPIGAAGIVVRTSRAYAGLSQRQLAGLTGYSPSTIARIESGGNYHPRWGQVLLCVHQSGLRVALVSPAGEVFDTAPLVLERNAGGRRYPAHLDVWRVERPGHWWAGDGFHRSTTWLSDCPPFSYALRRPSQDVDVPSDTAGSG
jgi:transcriptional regulator with XRE-family HTH domain